LNTLAAFTAAIQCTVQYVYIIEYNAYTQAATQDSTKSNTDA